MHTVDIKLINAKADIKLINAKVVAYLIPRGNNPIWTDGATTV